MPATKKANVNAQRRRNFTRRATFRQEHGPLAKNVEYFYQRYGTRTPWITHRKEWERHLTKKYTFTKDSKDKKRGQAAKTRRNLAKNVKAGKAQAKQTQLTKKQTQTKKATKKTVMGLNVVQIEKAAAELKAEAQANAAKMENNTRTLRRSDRAAKLKVKAEELAKAKREENIKKMSNKGAAHKSHKSTKVTKKVTKADKEIKVKTPPAAAVSMPVRYLTMPAEYRSANSTRTPSAKIRAPTPNIKSYNNKNNLNNALIEGLSKIRL
jgi:hypothetical protein